MAGQTNRLRVLFVSSEIFPLAKTGGLADVCSSLPIALTREGDIDMMLMMPGYDSVFEVIRDWDEIAVLPDLPGGPARLLLGTMPDSDLQIVLLDQPHVNGDKYEGKTIKQLRDEIAATTGENVIVRRFARFSIGQ